MPTSYAPPIAGYHRRDQYHPVFGPFIGAGFRSTILIMVISPVQALYFVIFVLLLQQFDGNIPDRNPRQRYRTVEPGQCSPFCCSAA